MHVNENVLSKEYYIAKQNA